MPSRAVYQITNRKEGKSAERDQSYRSCVLTLLIFFFICVILILATLPWRRNHSYSDYEDEKVGSMEGHHRQYDYRTRETTSTTESNRIYSNNFTLPNKTTELETTTSELELSTQDPIVMNVTNQTNNSSVFERPMNVDTTTEQEASTSSITTTELVHNSLLHEDSSTVDINSLLENSTFSTTTDPSSFATEDRVKNDITGSENSTTQIFTSTDFISETTAFVESETTTNSIIESTTRNEESTTMETTTRSEEDTTIKTTTRNEESTTIEMTARSEENTTIETTTTSLQSTTTDFTSNTVENSTTRSPLTTTSGYENEKVVCTTGECKNVASKMLFYMNHTVDPCDDFYEYACGGFEANQQTVDLDLENAAYERILQQTQARIHKGDTSPFISYYLSCVQYENVILSERIRLARKALNNVGRFYTTDNFDRDRVNFTELVAKLLLHNSALLFDVSPALNEYVPKQFTLKIGPTTYRDPFETEETDDACYASRNKIDQEKVDLTALYKEYKTCKNNTKEFINSVTEALTVLGVFNELGNPYNISQYVQTTAINIDLEIVQKFFAKYPSKDKIREAYVMKEYSHVTIRDLQTKLNFINWTKLIYMLTKKNVLIDATVQVYFYNDLYKGLQNLQEFEARDPMQFNNALLGLYAQQIYQQMVLRKHGDPKKYCLRVATNLLASEASDLYLSSFSSDELLYMNTTIHTLFEELKETLKLKIKRAEWIPEEGREKLYGKIDDMEVVTPDISYYAPIGSIYKLMKEDQVHLSDNYFENSIILMLRLRSRIYEQLFRNPGDPEQIWTHYAMPFQSKGLAIYGLDLVVIPFGAIDWSTKYDARLYDYRKFATLGNTIAHQIAHHFDHRGIYYKSGVINNVSILHDNSDADTIFHDYVECQRYDIYGHSLMMTLPSTGQTVYYKISSLSLNVRLSETMGLVLAYDTLDRLRSRKEVHLPWLNLDSDQLFYLTYAQMHCTKSPLTTSYVSLYEDEQLPSRIRIFLSASNNRLLGEAWNCPKGSEISPSYSCGVFPFLQFDDVTSGFTI